MTTRPRESIERSRAGAWTGAGTRGCCLNVSITQVKLVHTIIFVVFSACVIYALVSGVLNHLTKWTWVAFALVTFESAVLAWSGWDCPLTILAERLGAKRGAVADIFLPKWFADRIFPICGTIFLIACVMIVARLLGF